MRPNKEHQLTLAWFFREVRRLGLPVVESREDLVILPVGAAVFLAEALVALGFLAGLAPFLSSSRCAPLVCVSRHEPRGRRSVRHAHSWILEGR